MKNSKKVLAAGGLFALVAAMSIGSTISWLSAQTSTVVNTFAGGAISVTLDEAKVDEDGKKIDGEERVGENSYEYAPGVTLDKDPTVTVLKESEDCYVFLLVKDELTPCTDSDGNSCFTVNYDTENWKKAADKDDGLKENETLYMYSEAVEESDSDTKLDPIFTEVKVSENITASVIKELGEKTVEVTAYAVQTAELDEETAAKMAVEAFSEKA